MWDTSTYLNGLGYDICKVRSRRRVLIYKRILFLLTMWLDAAEKLQSTSPLTLG
jgi:hypothetical protein